MPTPKEDKFVIRFPAGMRENIRLAARHNGRSMNTELIFRFKHYDQLSRDLERAHQVIDSLLELTALSSNDIQERH
ncbi:DNA-binding protein [Pseudomonas protegens]|uniref:DNA-binding protein n=1 Tax=Pseudomonas protegens TaxID=380021 RepID=A0A2T6GB42_9PSED|nr:Arc family DNA-binding protein [Pseudomonas protegens]PUA41375.1 DNA-binding protein [Pseudomonas protegens]